MTAYQHRRARREGAEIFGPGSVLPSLAMTLHIVDHPLLHNIMARLRDRDTLIDVVS
jgi:hypothetical protein